MLTNQPASDASPNDELDRRRDYLDLTPDDQDRIRRMAAAFDSYLPEFIELFYSHLLSHPETAGFFTDSKLVERLKQTQTRYFKSLFEAHLDPAYADDRRRIGRAHADAGIDPQWFLGAYGFYIQHCVRRYADASHVESNEFVEGTLSLLKLILLDMGLALDAYFTRSTQRLTTALGLLERSNAELREFARLASHDLRTPLATVAGYCDEFLDEYGDSVPPRARDLIESARHRTMQLGTTLGKLLSLSEASARPALRSRVATRRVLDEVIERLRPELDARGIVLDLPNSLPDVISHPARLHEVFFALMSNAIKYMDKPAGHIGLGVEKIDNQHVFCVSDNGPGIPEAHVSHIFAPFWRLPEHRTLPGSGLGLHFVKTIIEEQGGRVWVESAPGKGSRFYFALPEG